MSLVYNFLVCIGYMLLLIQIIMLHQLFGSLIFMMAPIPKKRRTLNVIIIDQQLSFRKQKHKLPNQEKGLKWTTITHSMYSSECNNWDMYCVFPYQCMG